MGMAALFAMVPLAVHSGGAPEGAVTPAAPATPAAPVELVVLSHKVHQDAMVGKQDGGKNLLAEFIAKNPHVKDVKFITAGTPEVHDRLFREASLPKTEIDVAFIYSPYISPDVPSFFLPLDDYLAKKPLEDPADMIQSFWGELTFNGKKYAVPMRSGGQSFLFYNKKILAERGITPPKTLEDLVEGIKKAAFTRPNGERIYGYAKQGNKAEIAFSMGVFVRAMGGEFITRDFRSNLMSPEVLTSLRIYRELAAAGVLPDNFTALTNADTLSLFQNGRVAFYTAGPDYLTRLSKPGVVEARDIGFMNIPPLRKDLAKWGGASPTATFQWAMCIPNGSQRKDAAWDFVRFMSSKDAVLNMALSGNGPIRTSTFEDPKYKSRAPYLDGMLVMLKYGSPMFPAFENFTQVNDLIGEQIQQVVLGRKTAEQAMKEAEAAIGGLLPKSR